MKRFFFAVAVLVTLGLWTESASAQVPPPNPQGGGILQANSSSYGPVASPYSMPVYGMTPPSSDEAVQSSRYGFHPFIKRLFHIRDTGCVNCGGKHGGGGYPTGPQMSPANGGTLVFPNHPYTRSPRDFFYNNKY
jgi:hypothetical protein